MHFLQKIPGAEVLPTRPYQVPVQPSVSPRPALVRSRPLPCPAEPYCRNTPSLARAQPKHMPGSRLTPTQPLPVPHPCSSAPWPGRHGAQRPLGPASPWAASRGRVSRRRSRAPPPTRPPGTPTPARTPEPDPGPQAQPEPRGTCPPGQGRAGARGGLRAAASCALRKSNAFVPPVGPAPALHAPGESPGCGDAVRVPGPPWGPRGRAGGPRGRAGGTPPPGAQRTCSGACPK